MLDSVDNDIPLRDRCPDRERDTPVNLAPAVRDGASVRHQNRILDPFPSVLPIDDSIYTPYVLLIYGYIGR